MRINSISIVNYRQYKNNTITFNKSGEYDLHFVVAANGIGKTTLLNAITLCLYGEEPHLGLKSKALPIVNLDTLKNIENGGTCSVKIEITMQLEAGLVIFTRTLNYRKTEEGEPFRLSENFEATTNFRGESTEIYNNETTEEWLNKLLPKRIREFFFFDGEQLDTYFITDKGSRIETSIFEISQIDLLNNIQTRLSKTCDDLRKEASSINPNIKKINDLYELESKNKIEIDEQLKTCREQLSTAKIELIKCNEFLRGQSDISELEVNRNNFNNKLNTELQIKADIQLQLRKFIKKYTIILYLYPRVRKVLDLIKSKEVEGKLPPRIDKKLLVDMLTSGKCFVGSKELDCICMKNIESLIQNIEVTSEVSHLLVKIKGSLESLNDDALKYKEEKNKILAKLKYTNDNIVDLEEKINNIDSVLSSYTNKEEIKRVHEVRKNYENLINENQKKEGILEERLSVSAKRCDDLKNQLDREMDKNARHSKILEAKRFCEKANKLAENMIADLMGEVRDDIGQVMKELFFRLVWKKNTFSDVVLDRNYSISLMHVDGYECLGTCSAAERELLALSFTLALHEVSGFEAPLVIDTPVSRVSDTNRNNFANVLKDVSRNKQLILFLTPSEYSSEIREVFEKVSDSRFTIETTDERTVNLRRG